MTRALSVFHAAGLSLALLAAMLGTSRSAALAQSQRTSPSANVVRVVTHDFAFEMPDTLPAGLTTFRLQSVGKEPHHLMFYRLEPGKTLRDVFNALSAGGAHPAWMHPVGGPNAILAGGESVGTVVLEPGTYVAYCHVPSPDKVIHFAKGMIKTIIVKPTGVPPAPLPRAELTLTLDDYSFTFSRPPTRGHQRILAVNRGKQTHELILSKLAPGKTSADFVRWMEAQEGPPPVRPYGGTTDMPPGGTMVIDIDFEPGMYSALCRVRDAKDGQPHDRHGMAAEFVVR
jgi:hypothetical protein